jgi:Protein of unknown function (DUF3102)
MVRKSQPAAKQHDDVDTEKLDKGTKSLAVVSQNAAAVAEMIGYDLPYNKDRVVQEARFFMGQSAEAMLEAGKRLIVLKEHEDHGSFLQIVEEQMGMEARVAQKMMQAAAKYLTNPQLAGKANTFSLLGKSKLYEMMVMDDDTLIEIAEGGTVNGLNLDEIDRMSTRELKAALREQIATSEATEKVLATKNKKLDQVTAQLERKKAETDPLEWKWEPNRKALLETGESIVNFAQTELRRALIDIRETGESEGGVPEDIVVLQGQVLSALMQTLVVIQNDYGIAVDLESIVVPAWAQPDAGSKKK